MALFLIPPLLFIADLIYGGPLGLFPQVHFRHLLFAATSVCLCVVAADRGTTPRRAVGAAVLVLALFAWNATWALLVAPLRGVPAQRAWAEADALLMLVVIALALPVVTVGGRFERLRRLIVWMALLLAAVQFGIWLYGTMVPDRMVPLRALFTGFYRSESVFVGAMPDGAFRVFWIATLWCMLAVFWLPFVVRSNAWRFVGYALLSGALLASYSRALWIAMGLGLAVTLGERYRRHAPRLLAAAAVLLVAVALAGRVDFIANRIASLTSGETSMSERWQQLGALTEAWQEHTWFGTGYGGTASVVRSQEDPFSYEVVPLALLMKLGVVGMAGVGVFWILFVGAALHASDLAPAETASFLGACVSLLLFSSSNPVFLNFVGMGVFGCLVFQLAAMRAPVDAARTTG